VELRRSGGLDGREQSSGRKTSAASSAAPDFFGSLLAVRRVLLSVALLAGALFFATDCRWHSSFDDRRGLLIHVRESPIAPVAIEGQDNSAPLAGATVEIQRLTGGTVGSAVSDSHGEISIRLAPGTYRLVAQPIGDARLPAPPGPAQVTVPTVGTAVATLDYDTGIR
jgi:hypothetical protein